MTSLDTLRQLRAWCGHPLGQQLVEAEQSVLREVLSDVFGYHLVVLDPSYQPHSLEASRILHRVVHSCTGAGLDDPPGLLGCAESLPLQSDSIDAFVLPHVLERADDAHQVLREIDRCLIAEGHLIVLGFNPYGWWGVSRLLLSWRGKVPWTLRFVSVPRLKDWLSLLGFDTLRVRYLFPHPPWAYRGPHSKEKLVHQMHRDRWPWLAAAYLLVARKRVVTLTPIKPRWRPRRAVLAGGVAGTSQSRVRGNE
jgi:SAM-dependent methyltransferase